MGTVMGLLKELTGALTGDGRTEARGRAEKQAVEKGSPVTDDSVTADLEEVREEHGDVPLREDPPE